MSYSNVKKWFRVIQMLKNRINHCNKNAKIIKIITQLNENIFFIFWQITCKAGHNPDKSHTYQLFIIYDPSPLHDSMGCETCISMTRKIGVRAVTRWSTCTLM